MYVYVYVCTYLYVYVCMCIYMYCIFHRAIADYHLINFDEYWERRT